MLSWATDRSFQLSVVFWTFATQTPISPDFSSMRATRSVNYLCLLRIYPKLRHLSRKFSPFCLKMMPLRPDFSSWKEEKWSVKLLNNQKCSSWSSLVKGRFALQCVEPLTTLWSGRCRFWQIRVFPHNPPATVTQDPIGTVVAWS